MTAPILITGVPRSGTSLTAGLVHLAGVHGGELIPGNRLNRAGFYENPEIRNRIVKPYLASIGADPLGQDPLPALDADGRARGLRLMAEAIIGAVKGERYFVKEPKILLMWRKWHHAFPDAKWVVTRRDEEDILSSVMRTPFMRAYSTREDWQVWLNYHLDRIRELKAATDCFEFCPARLLAGDWSHLEDLERFLGVEVPREAAERFLEPLWFRAG